MIHAVHHHPRVCFALHYFGEPFDFDLCNEQADMVILNPTVATTDRGKKILSKLTCEKWAYACLNSTGAEQDRNPGYNWELYRRAHEHKCLLCDASGKPFEFGPEHGRGYAIDPRRMDAWPDIAIATLQDYLSKAPKGTWDGIFIDNGWRDCWPLNLTNLGEDTRNEINSYWARFMRESGVKLSRKVELPIIGNGHWQDFIGRRRMIGKMFENIPRHSSWFADAAGPVWGEGFIAEQLRPWSYDKRIILMPRHMRDMQVALALALLYDLWVCPPCGSGKVCEVSESKRWYAPKPAKVDESYAWSRLFINHEIRQRGRVTAGYWQEDGYPHVTSMPWEARK